jgi:predicted acyl esterase
MKTIKITILFITLLHACSFQLFAQNDIQQNYTKEEIQIEMRDGVKLFTSVYSPREKSISYPILDMLT